MSTTVMPNAFSREFKQGAEGTLVTVIVEDSAHWVVSPEGEMVSKASAMLCIMMGLSSKTMEELSAV